MSLVNLVVGLVVGFVVCAWVYEASPFEALAALGARIEEFATQAEGTVTEAVDEAVEEAPLP